MTQQIVRDPTAPADGPEGNAGRPAVRTVAWGLVRSARPHQWIKNVLVFAAPGAAGVLTQRDPLVKSLLAFAVFCLAASGTYLLNDAIDREADRLHPKKRHRPIAAGTVTIAQAGVASAILLIAALGLAAAWQEWDLALVAAVYVAVTISYSTWLKN